jgi:GNAT superfamily N-acetyltransferase
MLRELEPLGHDILPTCHNVDLLYDNYFLPALTAGEHGLVLATIEGGCIGAVFMVPERGVLEVPKDRAIDWGCYVVPAYRRQGVATELRQMAMRQLRRAGIKQVVTNILTRNKAGLGQLLIHKRSVHRPHLHNQLRGA